LSFSRKSFSRDEKPMKEAPVLATALLLCGSVLAAAPSTGPGNRDWLLDPRSYHARVVQKKADGQLEVNYELKTPCLLGCNLPSGRSGCSLQAIEDKP
jgi:hypothetical protein